MTAITLPVTDPPTVLRNGMVEPIVISVSGSEKLEPIDSTFLGGYAGDHGERSCDEDVPQRGRAYGD